MGLSFNALSIVLSIESTNSRKGRYKVKISVVTISFNQAEFLERAVRSVIEQDYDDIEYIVVDPGSTDSSRDIIEKYRDKISKVIFEPDDGPADGLNKGFACATGDIFCYINADDFFEPGAFRYVEKYFYENPAIDVLCGTIRLIDKKGRKRLRKRTPDRFSLKRYAAGICMIGQQATFFRSRAFHLTAGFNKENRTCWDGEMLVDMALAGCSFGRVYKVLGNFRIYADSISGSGRLNEEYLQDRARIMQKIKNSGIVLYPSWLVMIVKALYKLNLARHLRYLIIR